MTGISRSTATARQPPRSTCATTGPRRAASIKPELMYLDTRKPAIAPATLPESRPHDSPSHTEQQPGNDRQKCARDEQQAGGNVNEKKANRGCREAIDRLGNRHRVEHRSPAPRPTRPQSQANRARQAAPPGEGRVSAGRKLRPACPSSSPQCRSDPSGRNGTCSDIGLTHSVVQATRMCGAAFKPHDTQKIDDPYTQTIEHAVFRHALATRPVIDRHRTHCSAFAQRQRRKKPVHMIEVR